MSTSTPAARIARNHEPVHGRLVDQHFATTGFIFTHGVTRNEHDETAAPPSLWTTPTKFARPRAGPAGRDHGAGSGRRFGGLRLFGLRSLGGGVGCRRLRRAASAAGRPASATPSHRSQPHPVRPQRLRPTRLLRREEVVVVVGDVAPGPGPAPPEGRARGDRDRVPLREVDEEDVVRDLGDLPTRRRPRRRQALARLTVSRCSRSCFFLSRFFSCACAVRRLRWGLRPPPSAPGARARRTGCGAIAPSSSSADGGAFFSPGAPVPPAACAPPSPGLLRPRLRRRRRRLGLVTTPSAECSAAACSALAAGRCGFSRVRGIRSADVSDLVSVESVDVMSVNPSRGAQSRRANAPTQQSCFRTSSAGARRQPVLIVKRSRGSSRTMSPP